MKKNFLIDESVSRAFSDILEINGFSLEHVRDCCPSEPDDAVLTYAHAHGLVLITFDRGFGEVASQHPDMAGIVVIDRYLRSQCEAYADLIKQLLPQLQGYITVISPDLSYRQRPLRECRLDDNP